MIWKYARIAENGSMCNEIRNSILMVTGNGEGAVGFTLSPGEQSCHEMGAVHVMIVR